MVKKKRVKREKKLSKDLKFVIPKGDLVDGKVREDVVKKYAALIEKMKGEVGKAVHGQEEMVNDVFAALLADGHVLLEGVPGLAKTLLVRSVATVSGCGVKRIQFTVDLLPTDITGITTYTPNKGFETIKGPIFANFIIADEINRAPPKTQSALIESMQEKQVTISRDTFKLPAPFLVMATQNPLEQSGVYTLPEAQVDRFLFKIVVGYPKFESEEKIVEANMTLQKFEDIGLKPLTNPMEIRKMQEYVKKVYLSPGIRKYILNIVRKTRKRDFLHGKFIDWGGSPRASIALYIASKARAFMKGRNYVIPADVKDVAHVVLRHRIILSYRARAEGITSDTIIDEILGQEIKPF